jgi:hypothetical protein
MFNTRFFIPISDLIPAGSFPYRSAPVDRP